MILGGRGWGRRGRVFCNIQISQRRGQKLTLELQIQFRIQKPLIASFWYEVRKLQSPFVPPRYTQLTGTLSIRGVAMGVG
jgi:hypothetical protein